MHRFDPLDQSFYEYELKIKYEEIIQIETMLKTINKTNGFIMRTTFDSINVLSLPLLKNLREQILKILDSHNLLLDNNWAQLYNEDESPSFEPYKYPFKKNHLLLYPSHIPHEVKSLKTNESRLIIAFNTRKIKK